MILSNKITSFVALNSTSFCVIIFVASVHDFAEAQCCFSAQMNELETRENLQREWGGWGSKTSIYFDFWGGKWTKWTLLCSPSRIYYDFPASISLRFNFILSKGRKNSNQTIFVHKKKESVDRLCDSCALWRSVNMSRAQPKKNRMKRNLRFVHSFGVSVVSLSYLDYQCFVFTDDDVDC